jgi:hypothetical protein
VTDACLYPIRHFFANHNQVDFHAGYSADLSDPDHSFSSL